MAFDFSSLDLGSVLKFVPQIKEYKEKFKTFLPNILMWEDSILSNEEKAGNAKVIYCAVVLEKRIFIYANIMQSIDEKDVLIRTHFKQELFEILDEPEVFIMKMINGSL